jgi:hypothetical protein
MVTWRAHAHRQCDFVLLFTYQARRVIPERIGALAAHPGEQTGHPVINQPLRLYAEALRKIDRSW